MRERFTVLSLAALVLTTAASATLPAAASPALPPATVLRIPTSPLHAAPALDPNAPLQRGEFATAVRTTADRMALHKAIERDRAADNERFARGAGPGVSVRLRRSRF